MTCVTGARSPVKMLVDWTTSNMEYGSFYLLQLKKRNLQDAAAKLKAHEGEDGDLHAECRRKLEAIRKELEECQAQLRLHLQHEDSQSVAGTEGHSEREPAVEDNIPEAGGGEKCRRARTSQGINNSQKGNLVDAAIRSVQKPAPKRAARTRAAFTDAKRGLAGVEMINTSKCKQRVQNVHESGQQSSTCSTR
ncbi:hypothetical protein KP509_11G095500 [Ceratopteris richardii]|uniref:Uncharacterized protein n=1 Tax=Ceratopteris richardii TaxID=49495 RepID=A0A8T2TRX6_CERRI|nr:hypothetical protein KP509_11G095500 [Ceratopteris richardii]